MANVRVVVAQRNARLDALATAINGGGAGTIKIYTGTQPATADTATSGNVLLGTLTFSATSAPAASGGVLTFHPIAQDVSADINGTATWARIASGGAATVFDCDVGTTPVTNTIALNTTTIVVGGPIQISSFTLTDSGT